MALPHAHDPPAHLSDAQLAAYATRGQADALAMLYHRHASAMLAVAYRLLQSREDGATTAPQLPRSLDAEVTIERALRQLSPTLRSVLVLKEIEGFSHAEIARMLNISVGASEVRLHRALQALRTLLTPDKDP